MGSANDATLEMLKTEMVEFITRINTIYTEVSGLGEDDTETIQSIAPDRLSQLIHCESALEQLKTQLNTLSQ